MKKGRGHVNILRCTGLTAVHDRPIRRIAIVCDDDLLPTIAATVLIVQYFTDCEYKLSVGVVSTTIAQSRIIPSAPSCTALCYVDDLSILDGRRRRQGQGDECEECEDEEC